ncbi:DUF4920 domain-containing protein [Aquimarina sp. W85]|uniref:DUF4920 domain-containing protein n=1 Tax=Aquimarina rhodophyticola TaxID=3342246 RepID=UPI00366CFBA2
MKKSYGLIFFLSLLLGCSSSQKEANTIKVQDLDKEGYATFGEPLNNATIINSTELKEYYAHLKVGDTLPLTLISTVASVCKAKGCWMKIDLDDITEARVTFKDYGFFVPKDIEKDTIIAQGKAFIQEMSVADQKHYAQDAGKSIEEIAQIVQPKKTYSFIASGVLVKK